MSGKKVLVGVESCESSYGSEPFVTVPTGQTALP